MLQFNKLFYYRNVRIPINEQGKSRGIAYVDFATKDEAAGAVAVLSNSDFGGFWISVELNSHTKLTY